MTLCKVTGVGADTTVTCDFDGGTYGPGGTRPFMHCPYCGEPAHSDGHDVDRKNDEVHCEETNMANYRFCPGCGSETDHD